MAGGGRDAGRVIRLCRKDAGSSLLMVRHRLASASHVSPPNTPLPAPKSGEFFLSALHASRGSLSVVTFGDEDSRMFRLWALLMGLMIAGPALADQRVALVIGNDAIPQSAAASSVPTPTPQPTPKAAVARPAQSEPKLARLPDPIPAETARPRSARENCSRSGNATFCVSSALPPAH